MDVKFEKDGFFRGWLAAGLLLCAWMILLSIPARASAGNGSEVMIVLDASRSAGRFDPQSMAIEGTRLLLDILPDSVSAGVALAGESARVLSAPVGPLEKEKHRCLLERLKKLKFTAAAADFSAAATAAAETLERRSSARAGLLIVLSSPDPPRADGRLIRSLKAAGLLLYVVQLDPGQYPSESWHEAARATGGVYFNCRAAADLPQQMLRAFLCLAALPCLPVGKNSFQANQVTRRLTLIARRAEGERASLVTPDNESVFLDERLKAGARERFGIVDYGPLTVVDIKLPSPGRWGLGGVQDHQTVVITHSRQGMKTVLPRRLYLNSEKLTVTAFFTQNGRLVRLPEAARKAGIIAELRNADGGGVSQTILLDDGREPDREARDGIYSASLALKGHMGLQDLLVSNRTRSFSRRIVSHFEVLEGEWLGYSPPEEPLRVGSDQEIVVETSKLIPMSEEVSITARFGRGEPVTLAREPGRPQRFSGLLPVPKQPGPKKLIVERSGAANPVALDIQQAVFTIDVIADSGRSAGASFMFFIAVLLFAGIFAVGAVFVFRRRRRMQEITALPLEEFEEMPAEPSAAPEVPAEEPAAPPPEPEPETEQKVLETEVAGRMEEVVAVQMGEPVHGKVDRPELGMDQLDRDSDPEFATDTAFRMEDPFEPRRLEGDDDGEAEEGEGVSGFSKLSQEELDDVFKETWGGKAAPGGREAAAEGGAGEESPVDGPGPGHAATGDESAFEAVLAEDEEGVLPHAELVNLLKEQEVFASQEKD